MHRLSDVSLVPWAKGICAALQSSRVEKSLCYWLSTQIFSLNSLLTVGPSRLSRTEACFAF